MGFTDGLLNGLVLEEYRLWIEKMVKKYTGGDQFARIIDQDGFTKFLEEAE